MLNTLLASYRSPSRIEEAEFLLPEKDDVRPSPEDFSILGPAMNQGSPPRGKTRKHRRQPQCQTGILMNLLFGETLRLATITRQIRHSHKCDVSQNPPIQLRITDTLRFLQFGSYHATYIHRSARNTFLHTPQL
jgi:hypothetical protein